MSCTSYYCAILCLTLSLQKGIEAWTCPPFPCRPLSITSLSNARRPLSFRHVSTQLFQSSNASDEILQKGFSTEEIEIVNNIYKQADHDQTLEQSVRNALPNLHPSLVMKLKQAQGQHDNASVAQVSQSLNNILNQQLEQAKQTLFDLLNAGEIRKLDSLIGKAARENRLDAAFFNVLTANLQNAKQQEATDAEVSDAPSANRAQILQHVYTRCQEEVEKTIPPGTALLNKLLRTEQPAIRSNLYEHYLVAERKTITTPDGKQIELAPTETIKPLVSLDDFCGALAHAVQQIRTVERAGGTDRATAAALVESCRSVAKEARMVLGSKYGPEAPQVKQLEEGLQPVFRPVSADSPYIKGL
ncbi:hypothetical protein MPSEU_000925200 [Mayamaea pseudoterrestris]|nr:hypothetical protein MPSEU_000925200 [Mayamaea pseudoterrestris]